MDMSLDLSLKKRQFFHQWLSHSEKQCGRAMTPRGKLAFRYGETMIFVVKV